MRELNEDDANLENADVGTSAVRKGADGKVLIFSKFFLFFSSLLNYFLKHFILFFVLGLSAAERAAAQYAIAAAGWFTSLFYNDFLNYFFFFKMIAEELEELNNKPESELTSNDKCKLIRLVFEVILNIGFFFFLKKSKLIFLFKQLEIN